MCDQETYSDGDIVWVKLGSCWWPGVVWGLEKLTPNIVKSFRKTPIAVVKFFQEETFEYVRNTNLISKYDCSRKNDFIRKGLDLYRSKHSHMDKFPDDVCTAERLTNGNPDIITSDEFLPQKKESYANIFGTPVDTSAKRNSLGKRGRPPSGSSGKSKNVTPTRITHPRLIQKYLKGSSDYKAHILVQPSVSPISPVSPTSVEHLNTSHKLSDNTPKSKPEFSRSSPVQSPNLYTCHECDFTATRINLIVLHSKVHNSGGIPYTPSKPPKPKPPSIKAKPKSVTILDDDEEYEVASTSKKRKVTLKTEGRQRGRPRNLLENVAPDVSTPVKNQNKDKPVVSPPKRKLNKQKERESKKAKTDVEIKNSLLADWNEDSEEESMDVLTSLKLSQIVNETTDESNKSVPAQNEDDTVKSQTDTDNAEKIKMPIKIGNNEKSEKKEQASCFDFEEDEDLQIENIGKKIPRLNSKSDEFPKKGIDVINPVIDTNTTAEAQVDKTLNTVEKENNNSRVNTEIDFDSEIDNLLNETTVPELPPLPSHSNFQKSQPVKVPDKEKPADTPSSKSIFKTKTFFRSRHSRSQDAIEKYVADNTSTDKPPTYMNEPVELERSSDVASESLSDNSSLSQDNDILPVPPKTETVRVTKFAPKIQLKKLNAALVNKNKSLSQDTNDTKHEDINNIVSDTVEKSISDKSNLSSFADALKDNIVTDRVKTPEIELSKTSDIKKINSEDDSMFSIKNDELNVSKTPPIDVLNNETTVQEPVIEPKSNDNINIPDKPELPHVSEKSLETEVSVETNSIVDSLVKAPSVLDQDKSSTKDEGVHKNDNANEVNDVAPIPKLPEALDEPIVQKVKSPLKIISTKIIKPQQGKEKILNFDVDVSQSKQTTTLAQNQKIIIRRTTNTLKSRENSQESLILCNKNAEKWNDDDVQTFTIEEPSGTNDDLLDPKLTKVSRSFSAKPHNTIITSTGEIIQTDKAKSEDTVFDINSMPIVLSDDIESAKTDSKTSTINQKNVQIESTKSKSDVVTEKPTIIKKYIESPVKKSIIVKSVIEKTVSPNILSKSGKGKTLKHLLIVDKKTGEKKIIKAGDLNDELKEQRLQSEARSAHQTEKIIINSKFPGGKKTQKVIISPSTKNQVVVGRLGDTGEPEMYIATNPSTIPKNVTKVAQNNPSIDHATGNAIMFLTNSQGVKSKILLTPEQQLMFPKGKMQSVMSQSPTTSKSMSGTPPKSKSQSIVITSAQILNSESNPVKPQITQAVRTMVKQKSTILNSKGQIVMSGGGNKRTILTTMPGQAILTSKGQLIAPQSSVITTSSKILNLNKTTTIISSSNQIVKSVTSHKVIGKPRTEVIAQPKAEKSQIANATSSVLIKSQNSKVANQNITQGQLKESSLILPQKPGTVMHLTAAQFEYLQKTGQLISTTPNKTGTGKVTQKFIVQKIINPKEVQEPEIKKSNVGGQNRLENVYSHEVPPLAPLHSDQSLKKQRSKETKKFVPPEPMINPIADCALSDADDLIPATIIPTRKHEMLQKKHNDQLKLENQRKTELLQQEVVNTVPEPAKQVKAASDETQISTNTLNDPQKQLLAIPGENFGGPPNSFFLCVEENGTLTPIDNQPLVLEDNQLVPMVMNTTETSNSVLVSSSKDQVQPTEQQILEIPADQAQQNILLNIGDQQILIDHQTLLTLLAGDGQQLVTNDGQQLVFQGSSQQILSALANNPELASLLGGGQQILLNPSGTDLTSQVAEDHQIINASTSEGFNYSTDVQPNVNQDILAAALAGTEVFQQDALGESIEIPATDAERMMMDIDSLSPNLQNINMVQNVHSNVFETSSTLNQPIMSPLEIPTKKRSDEKAAGLLAISNNSTISKNLDDSLAVIGVTTPNIPTSLDLPITVTNPRIAAKTTSPLSLTNSGVYQSSSLLNNTLVSSGIGIYESEKSHCALSNNNLSDVLYDSNKLPAENIAEDNLPIASSMPCLDDSSSESFVENASKPEIETKTYSPISMPILTDDLVDVTISKETSETIETSETADENIIQPDQTSSVVEFETKSISMPTIPEPADVESESKENTVENAVEETQMDVTDDNSQNTIDNMSVTEESLDESEKKSQATENPESIENPEATENPESIENPETTENPEMIVTEEQPLNEAKEQTTDDESKDSCSVSELCISTPADDETSQSDTVKPSADVESIKTVINNAESNSNMDEMCADTPPNMLDHDSAAMYEPEAGDDATIMHNEADGNSLPDHTREELYISCSSESAALPDSTSPNLDVASPVPEPRDDDNYSDSSSDASTEIPIQPLISVSHSVVQNFSSMLNNPDSDEKTHDSNAVDVSEQFENNEKSSPKNKVTNER